MLCCVVPCCVRLNLGYYSALLCKVTLRILLLFLVVSGRPQETVVHCCVRLTSEDCYALLCEVDLSRLLCIVV